MNREFPVRLLLIAGLALLVPSLLFAQTYVLERSVISAGGARMTGSTYSVTGTAGQSSPVGISTGSTYHTYHGFWHTVGGAPLLAMVLAIELLDATTARLYWDPVALATAYDLYRNTSSYFAATGSPWITVAAPDTSYSFTAGIGDAALNYFFRGKATNATDESPASNTVGEMSFDESGATRILPPPRQSQTER